MDIDIDDFPLPVFDAKLATLKHQLMDGRGVTLLRGFPDDRVRKAAGVMGVRWATRT